MKRSTSRVSALILLSFVVTSTCNPLFVEAHVGIPSSPTTSCGSIDSTDLTTHTGNQIDSRIATASPFSVSKKLYSTEGDSTTMTGATTTPWVRNNSVWTGSVDFTGVNAWTQMYNGYSNRYQHKATLISPRHFVTAHHWGVAPSSTLAFITNTNETVYRTVLNTMQVGTTDIEVGVLDSDVPDSITYYPIVASSTLNTLLYQFVPPQTLDVPIVAFNQFEELFTMQLLGYENGALGFVPYTNISSSRNPTRLAYSKNVVAGDSGSPLFMIIDGRPIILTTFSSASNGVSFGAYISQINTTISALGNSGGYTVTEYNPTCFTSYIPNNVPVFTNSTATTTQVHYSSATPILTYTATDADVGDTLTYSLVSLQSVASTTMSLNPNTYFSLQSSTGVLSQTADIDTTVLGSKLALGVKVVDNRTPQAVKYATTTITVDFPIITSAIRKNSILEITYDSNLATTSVPATSDFVVKVNGTTRTVSSVGVTGKIVKLTMTSPASAGDTITVSYTPGTNKIKDIDGSFALAIPSSSPVHVSNSHAGDVDTSFDSGTGFNNTASAVVVDSNDKVYVGGFFTQYNGTTANRIIKLNADGSVDSSFNTGTAFGAGAGVNVSKILLQADGKIVVFGLFSSYKGTAVTNIVRLNTDGSLDTTFNSGGAGLVGSYIQDADIQSDGKIVIVGSFSQYNGTTRYGVARLNSNGTLDTTFVPATNSSDLNIRAVDIQSDGKVLIAGSFTAVGGVSRNLVARLTTTGSLDSTFAPSSTVNDYIADTYTVKQLSNGNVLVGGLMSYVNSNWGMVLFDSSATALNYFNGPSIIEADGIMDTYEQLDGKILVAGGAFVYGSHVYKDLVRLDASGVLDETFGHTETGGTSFSNVDYGIAINSSGDIYVVGTFTNHAGVAQSGIVKLFGSTEFDITAPTVVSVTSSNANGRVKIGTTIPIQVVFSEDVIVSGNPTLTLSLGTTTRNATYVSGSGSSTLTFNYAVQEGDYTADLEYVNANSLGLNGGSVADAVSNTAILTLPVPQTSGSLGYNKALVIDGTVPTLFASSVDTNEISLIYDEDMYTTAPSTSDFTVVKNGSISLTVTSVSVSGSTITLVLNNSLTPSDTLTLAYTPGTNPIRDLAFNEASSFSATTITNTTVDGTAPTISSVSTTNQTSSSITITWTTDEAADSLVEYGPSSTYTASSSYSATLGTAHTVVITGLSANSNFHFRVVSADAQGNKAYGTDSTFNTSGTAVISGGDGGGGSSGGGGSVAYATPIITQIGTSTTTLSLGQSTLTVKQVQQYLNTHGFPIAVTGPGSYGKETNTFGPLTKTALLKFQKALSLPQTGTLNPQTLLYITQMQTRTTTVGTTTQPLLCAVPLYLTKPIQYGTKNNPKDVKLLETFLNEFAGFTLHVDGVYGAKDRQAVITWQEQNKDTILTPWGLTRGTGYIFTTSLQRIKQQVEAGCAVKK